MTSLYPEARTLITTEPSGTLLIVKLGLAAVVLVDVLSNKDGSADDVKLAASTRNSSVPELGTTMLPVAIIGSARYHNSAEHSPEPKTLLPT